MKYKMLLDLIPTGEHDAIAMIDLARLLQIDERSVRQKVHKARKNGELICSSSKGYYYPANLIELYEYTCRTGAGLTSSVTVLKPFVSAYNLAVSTIKAEGER